MKEVCCRVTLAAWKAEVGNGGSVVKNPSEIQEPLDLWVWSLYQEDTLEKRMATDYSILAWRIPWTEEPGGLSSMVLQRVGHNWVTKQEQQPAYTALLMNKSQLLGISGSVESQGRK